MKSIFVVSVLLLSALTYNLARFDVAQDPTSKYLSEFLNAIKILSV